MALFGRKDKPKPAAGAPAVDKGPQDVHPIVGRTIHCRVCGADRQLSRCWRRTALMRRCPCCGTIFESPGKLYREFQPSCPKCEEPLEQAGFDYGLCDGCGSKYEIIEGTKPGLLPNRQQRAAMAQHGKVVKKRP